MVWIYTVLKRENSNAYNALVVERKYFNLAQAGIEPQVPGSTVKQPRNRSVLIIYQEPVTHLKLEYNSADSEQSRCLVKSVQQKINFLIFQPKYTNRKF